MAENEDSKISISEEKRKNPFETLFKMRREVPEFKRCCFCIPLRRGLIGWGYLKLGLNLMASGFLIFLIIVEIRVIPIIIIIEILFLLTDMVFNVLLIVGGHTKNVKLLRVTYFYSMVWVGLAVLSLCWLMYLDIKLAIRLLEYSAHFTHILSVLSFIIAGLAVEFVIITLHVYIILLIRSEVQKLQGQRLEMQFTNPITAEAHCMMHSDPAAAE